MNAIERFRATYAFEPVDHLYRREFYIWQEAIEKWGKEGLPEDYAKQNLFNFDPAATVETGLALGWCEPPFVPAYEEKVIRTEGDTEIIQDRAGRWLRVFRGRRHGFMPDYLKHPVTSMDDWEKHVKQRLDPADPSRYAHLDETCGRARALLETENRFVDQRTVGGYMYLRALMGPEEVLYAFHDQPELIHAMMQRWAELVHAGLEQVQARVEIDQLALAEDICYKTGPLISPQMMREFLFPYYTEVLGKARARQRRHVYCYVDTDGDARPVIPGYMGIGMDVMMPFEVASGCDVVEIGRQYPGLVMFGGIDKRVLAQDQDAIEAHLEHTIPAMLKRGGYVPMCDHGVPDNVPLGNYLYYRRRICELDH